MASVSLAMDHIIQKTYSNFPHLLAFHTVTQAETFSLSPPTVRRPFTGFRSYFRSSLLAKFTGYLPVEIIEDGKTGFLVEPDSIEGLVTGIKNLDRIDRSFCRKIVEQKYSLEALGNRAINWFEEIFCQ